MAYSADAETNSRLRAEQAAKRAKRRAHWQRVADTVDSMFHFDIRELLALLRMLVKWGILASGVGILAGTASAIFLISLDWATRTRIANINLIFLLPVAGLIVGWVYHRFAGAAAQGNNLVIEEVHSNTSRIPARMTPFILFGTVVTHWFGGSAGREGTAIQMGASLADTLRRLLRLGDADRRLMLMAGISGGFGSVFGTPVAGFVFGMEVQSIGRIRYEGIIPCLIAAYVGDLVTRAWGATHSHYPTLANVDIDLFLLLKVGLAGITFGLTAILFIELTHGIRFLLRKFVRWSPLNPVIGGLILIGLTLILSSTDYLGLGLPLIQNSLNGVGVIPMAFLLKLIFTALTLGSGFLGGEVTPLFVIGSTLGFTLGRALGVDPTFMASVGFVAVFAGASNTPLACALMGMELFGGGSMLYLILGCAIAYLTSGHRGIYVTQRVGSPKIAGSDVQIDESLRKLGERRSGWLPPLPNLTGEIAHRLVRALMSRRVVVAREDMPIGAIVDLALSEGVRSLPVVNAQKQVVGIITDNDLSRAGIAANLSLLKQMTPEERKFALQGASQKAAQDVMTRSAVTIQHTAPLAQAIDLLTAHNLKRLPVVDGNDHLVGMITRSDILREMVFSRVNPGDGDSLFDWHSTIQDVELESVATISPDSTAGEIVATMRASNRKRVIVTDAENRAVGIITESDLLSRISNGSRSPLLAALRGQQSPESAVNLTQAARDLMTAPVITVSADGSAYEALKTLMDNQIKRLPVVDADRCVIGMVGRVGLLRALLKERR